VPRAVLIVNPFASRVTEDLLERVIAQLGDVDVRRTMRPGHATELAREAEDDVDTIYVFSGDGGFNEVLNGVGGSIPLGFLPGGGASVLSRALGLPRDPVAAASLLRRGAVRRISLGRVNGRRFGFSAGVGLDAELVRRVEAHGRSRESGRVGNVTFATEAFGLLAHERFRLVPELEVRGHGRATFALAANCDPYTYAGRLPLHVAPRARFELGLDLVAPRRVTPTNLTRLVAYALTGRGQDRADDVIYAHDVDRMEVACDRPLPLQADGEDLGDVREVVFEAERDAVSVLVR
jgi:diacylglycerol kinase family enzyme